MDYRLRDYYLIYTDYKCWNMRHELYKSAAPSIKRHSVVCRISSPCFISQEMISCLKSESQRLELELDKAKRLDRWSNYIKICKLVFRQ